MPKENSFKLTCKTPPSVDEANKAADEIEAAVGEIANGKRKAANIPIEPMAVLVQFARNAQNAGHCA